MSTVALLERNASTQIASSFAWSDEDSVFSPLTTTCPRSTQGWNHLYMWDLLTAGHQGVSLSIAPMTADALSSVCVFSGFGDQFSRQPGDRFREFVRSGTVVRFVPLGADTGLSAAVTLLLDQSIKCNVTCIRKAASDPLAGYAELDQPNWDGFGAEPITSETLSYARNFLKALPTSLGPPEISPSADGGIALEWVPETGKLHKLFIDIGPGEVWHAYWKMRDGKFDRQPGSGHISKETSEILSGLFNRF